jgi:outer membrane protein OmpA-like peptidoglycan-associated protein
MNTLSTLCIPRSSLLATLALASALAIPVLAQDAQPASSPQSQDTSATTSQQPPAATHSTPAPAKEGFWGRMNPFARKKWVKKQTDPINDRLTELDEVNAKNATDIQATDSRAQAGIRNAQSSADAANQAATAAGSQAQQAQSTAQGASDHVSALNGTVNGLDQYKPVTEIDIAFRGGQPILSADAKKQLDDFAATLADQKGYVLDVESHSPLAGSAGLQSSERLGEAVNRYLVTQHDIPVYRLHMVALGNAPSSTEDPAARIRKSTVHVRLMENSLAAQGGPLPQGGSSSTGAERP